MSLRMIKRLWFFFLVSALTPVLRLSRGDELPLASEDNGSNNFYEIADELASSDFSADENDLKAAYLVSEKKEPRIVVNTSMLTQYDPNLCNTSVVFHCNPAYPYRTFTGACNNLNHTTWGAANECLLRFQPAVYEGYDGLRTSTAGGPLPNARDISWHVFRNVKRHAPGLSLMFAIYGQTVSHDFSDIPPNNNSVSCCSPESANNPDCIPIPVRSDDPLSYLHNIKCFGVSRTQACSICEFAKRQQISIETAILDASIVYSADETIAKQKRLNDGTGKMRTDFNELFSKGRAQNDLFCPANTESICYFEGDAHLYQYAALDSLYTVFLGEHNRLADILSTLNPHWEEERLYQEARKINNAELQCITYKEFLPHLLGPHLTKKFDLLVKPGTAGSQYNPNVRIGLWNEFSVAAFRLHSMVQTDVELPTLKFKDLHSNPGPISHGLTNHLAEESSHVPTARNGRYFVEDAKSVLYRKPGMVYGNDLDAFDIQRGRDHGLPPYTQLVRFCSSGKTNVLSFDDLSPQLMTEESVHLLRRTYQRVEDVDLKVGMLMEHHLPGAQLGPTAACVIVFQFYSAKFGDRFYFEHEGGITSFTAAQRENLKKCSLSRLLCDNTDITIIQRHAMLFPDDVNPEVPCDLVPSIDLTPWREVL